MPGLLPALPGYMEGIVGHDLLGWHVQCQGGSPVLMTRHALDHTEPITVARRLHVAAWERHASRKEEA